MAAPARAPRAPPSPGRAPAPGLADLHLHQWGAYNFGGRWMHGRPEGPPAEALAACPAGRGGVARAHAEVRLARPISLQGSLGRQIVNELGRSNPSDDLGLHLPTGATGAAPWAGWPTPDSVAHEQAWEGWLRLAHDGLPMYGYLLREVLTPGPGAAGPELHVRCAFFDGAGLRAPGCRPGGEVALDDLPEALQERVLPLALQAFSRGDRADLAARAADEGLAGLNLAVVSLLHFRSLCTLLRRADGLGRPEGLPAGCEDGPQLEAQARAAAAWAARNHRWAGLARSPAEARSLIAEGRLAIVLSVEASDLMDDPDRPVDEQLDALWALGVRVVQPVHEYDHRFAGAAPVASAFGALQWWRTRADPRAQDPRAPGHAAARRAAADAWEDRARPGRHPVALSAAAMLLHLAWPRGPSGFRCGPEGRARCFDAEGRWTGARNALGLTDEGRALLDGLRRRGMVLDIAHLSHRAIEEADAHLPEGVPWIHSHALPAAALRAPTEHHQPPDLLARTARRGGMIGLRTGDDPLRPGLPGEVGAWLDGVDCGGTAAALAALIDGLATELPALGLAWGTDLNGFINQAQPTGQLRPLRDGLRPCAAAVPSFGSEVQRRGLAHIGLLPALQLEARAAAAEVGPAPAAAVDAMGWGAERFLRVWEGAGGAASGSTVPLPPARAAPLPDPRLELPVAGLGPDGDPVRVRIPLLAAIEATLPYVDLHGWGRGAPTPEGLDRAAPVVIPERARTLAQALGVDAPTAQRAEDGGPARVRSGPAPRRHPAPLDRFPEALRATLSADPRWIPAGVRSLAERDLRACAMSDLSALRACLDDPDCLAGPPERCPGRAPPVSPPAR